MHPIQKNAHQTVFVEDFSERERAVATAAYPSGLENLGNTCYLASTVQFLRSSEGLSSLLARSEPRDDAQGRVVRQLKGLFATLDRSKGPPLAPLQFLAAFRGAHPQFSEQDNSGAYKQQDAQESLVQLVNDVVHGTAAGEKEARSLFEVQMDTKMTCVENPDEPNDVRTESLFHLTCHIGNSTNHLFEGLTSSLTETITKQSPSLNKSSDYLVKKSFKSLPEYLVVHFMRFFWKANEKVKAKILRQVKYPLVIDLVNLCSENLKAEITEVRERARAVEDRILSNALKGIRKRN
jgi:ubiquitin carboxyl-terminal hydrolase 14